MSSNEYHFTTHWRVKSTIKEVADILDNAADLVRWWPAVYLDVQVLQPGNEQGLGNVVSLYTKGWLPYTLRWQFRVTQVRADGFTIEAWGDVDGRGIWTFEQVGPWVKPSVSVKNVSSTRSSGPYARAPSTPRIACSGGTSGCWAMSGGLPSSATTNSRPRPS